jgi:hypothetical protein
VVKLALLGPDQAPYRAQPLVPLQRQVGKRSPLLFVKCRHLGPSKKVSFNLQSDGGTSPPPAKLITHVCRLRSVAKLLALFTTAVMRGFPQLTYVFFDRGISGYCRA